MNKCIGEIAVFQKSGSPLTKRIALAPKGRAMTGSACEIAQALGKACREGRSWRCVCPLHGGHSLVLGDGDNALLVKCFGGNCATEDILAELRRRGLIEGRDREAGRTIRPPLQRANNRDNHERRQHEKAAWLWLQRHPIKGTIAEKYLRGRWITCPLPPTLAFLPPNKPEHHPAMVAAFGLPDESEPGLLREPRSVEAIHLTLLKPDGSGKAELATPKLIVGSPRSKPIVLAPPNDLLGLAIAEGIETGLSVSASTRLGVWAASSAARMPVLADEIPDFIECVTIYREADLAGELQASKLAQSLVKRGMEVRIAEASP
jgi:hypothetical protein